MMSVVTLVLAVACANVAGVLLARAASRRQEIAVRLAMGASRARLVRQLLTETVMLFACGAGAGLLLAVVLTQVFISLLPALPFPIDLSMPLDGRVLAFATGLSLAAALFSGLAPALQSSRTDVGGVLKYGAPILAGRSRIRSAFVVAQVASSIVLVVSAGLFVRALQRAGARNPGFDPHGVELATVGGRVLDRPGSAHDRPLLIRRGGPPVSPAAALEAELGSRKHRTGGAAIRRTADCPHRVGCSAPRDGYASTLSRSAAAWSVSRRFGNAKRILLAPSAGSL